MKVPSSQQKVIPVSTAPKGFSGHIDYLEGGWHLRKRLTELGFIKGEDIKILKNSGKGPVLVEIKNTRFALGRGEAEKVFLSQQS